MNETDFLPLVKFQCLHVVWILSEMRKLFSHQSMEKKSFESEEGKALR